MIFVFSVCTFSFVIVRNSIDYDLLFSLLCVITGNRSRITSRTGTRWGGKRGKRIREVSAFWSQGIASVGIPSLFCGWPNMQDTGARVRRGGCQLMGIPRAKVMFPGTSGVTGARLHPGPDGICALWKHCWTKSLNMVKIIAASSIHL